MTDSSDAENNKNQPSSPAPAAETAGTNEAETAQVETAAGPAFGQPPADQPSADQPSEEQAPTEQEAPVAPDPDVAEPLSAEAAAPAAPEATEPDQANADDTPESTPESDDRSAVQSSAESESMGGTEGMEGEFPEATGDTCPAPEADSPGIDLSKVVSVTEAEPTGGVTPVVGVKFQRACKTYFFNSGQLELKIGEMVIVETDRGLGLARVVTPAVELQSDKVTAQLKRVIRKAQWNDLERDRKNREREMEALKLCREKIPAHGLPMKLVRVEYLHDASKAVFFFSAESRVDFRELVKDLARQLHTRIEMRQIGVRDESKIIGGIGPCGREICCSTFLTDFVPVSVRMAKDQNLAMNPGKVSGLCGRLMCCLSYEHKLYQEQVKKMPKKGKTLRCNDGPCRVIDLNILAGKVLVELESGKTIFISAAELRPLDQIDAPMVERPPEEKPKEDKSHDDDYINDLADDHDQPRPRPARRETPRGASRPQPPPGQRQGQPRQDQPRSGQPRPDGRRDDRRRDGRRPGPDRAPQDRPADRGQPDRPGERPRSDRLQPPASTVAYTGSKRPPGAQAPRPDRDRSDRPDRPSRGPDNRPDRRPDDRRDQRPDRPVERTEDRQRDRTDQPPPTDRPAGGPAAPGEQRPPSRHRRRRKNH